MITDHAKQCNSARQTINKLSIQCRRLRASIKTITQIKQNFCQFFINNQRRKNESFLLRAGWVIENFNVQLHLTLLTFPKLVLLFFAEAFQWFLVEIFWSLKYFGHLSHSCIKTCHETVLSLYFQTFLLKWQLFLVISKTFHSMTEKIYRIGCTFSFLTDLYHNTAWTTAAPLSLAGHVTYHCLFVFHSWNYNIFFRKTDM